MAHRGVEDLREAERDADLAGQFGHPRRRQVEPDAERLQHVGRAGGRRRGPVAVLDDPVPGAGDDDGGHGGDVDGVTAVTAGADDVDAGARDLDPDRVLQHRVDQPGELVDRLALGAQGDQEAGQLGRRTPRRSSPAPSPRRSPRGTRSCLSSRAAISPGQVGEQSMRSIRRRRARRGHRVSPAGGGPARPRPRRRPPGRAGAAPPRRPATRSPARRPAAGR